MEAQGVLTLEVRSHISIQMTKAFSRQYITLVKFGNVIEIYGPHPRSPQNCSSICKSEDPRWSSLDGQLDNGYYMYAPCIR